MNNNYNEIIPELPISVTEPKEKLNFRCDKCKDVKNITFRVGNWGVKSYICYPCLMGDVPNKSLS